MRPARTGRGLDLGKAWGAWTTGLPTGSRWSPVDSRLRRFASSPHPRLVFLLRSKPLKPEACPMVRGVVDSQRLLASGNRCQVAVPSCSCPTEPGVWSLQAKALPRLEAVSSRYRLLCPAPPPALSPVPTNAALMGHPFRYATEPHTAPKSSTSACASGCQHVLTGLRFARPTDTTKSRSGRLFRCGRFNGL